MKALIAEDDLTSQLLLQELLKPYASVHVVDCGSSAVDEARKALEANQPFDLICLDIMMPILNGHAALKLIRALESEHGLSRDKFSKILMITALNDINNISDAIDEAADAYLVKPIVFAKLKETLIGMSLIKA